MRWFTTLRACLALRVGLLATLRALWHGTLPTAKTPLECAQVRWLLNEGPCFMCKRRNDASC